MIAQGTHGSRPAIIGGTPFLFLINMQERGKLRAGDASELNALELLFLDNLFFKRDDRRAAASDGASR